MREINKLKTILAELYQKETTPDEALKKLKDWPYRDIDFAKIDVHRSLRKNFPEVVFGKGKTLPQLKEIIISHQQEKTDFFASKVNLEYFSELQKQFPEIFYFPEAGMLSNKAMPKVAYPGTVLIVTGGTADLPAAMEAKITLQYLANKVEMLIDVGVAGIHRLFAALDKILAANVIVAVAGMEGALPSLIAGLTDKPVIGVPTDVGYGAAFKGLSALLNMLNSCAEGLGVVNINNGFGAGYLAASINRLNIQGNIEK
jgi:NCAIR mutase (PurE)-related protein